MRKFNLICQKWFVVEKNDEKITFIIVREIEFGDLKSSKCLTLIWSKFFSSILFIQLIKIKLVFICLNKFFYWKLYVMSIFFSFFFQNSNDDKEGNDYLDNNQIDLNNNNEEYIYSIEVCLFFCSSLPSFFSKIDCQRMNLHFI